ncbi:MAG TPA: ROK family protein [Steroidobacteraceae bacterium]|nr:ROK family protein [Steroidobacteraceae bacterium]
MTAAPKLVAGVELGGTKCVCVLGTGPDDVRAQERLATTDPATTLARIESVLGKWVAQHGVIAALGVASFGPLALRKEQPAYGSIAATTKQGWSHTDIVNRFADRFGVPIGFDTDVNGAALAEGRWGAARGLRNFAYVTVGTGIGVGLIVNGAPVLGCNHPEMGHLRIVRKAGDAWPGICAFHGDCVEGLASGPAIEARAGMSADRLGADHEVWSYVAHALGQLLHAMVLTTAPERILLGGGVMAAQSHLFERVREELRRSLNRYVEVDEVGAGLSRYVTAPGLGTQAGPLGALALALDAVGSRGG